MFNRASNKQNRFRYFHLMITAIAMVATFVFGQAAHAAKRVALVVGNSAYQNAAPLKNPANDAEDMAEKLARLGFEVVVGLDLTNDQMKRKVRDFSQKLEDADVSLFFYAGHAMQIDGQNYLAPVDTAIASKADLDFETVSMDLIQRQMERNTKTSLIFLDACRDNPLSRSLRSKSRNIQVGLAAEQAPEGTLIAFSTNPGNVALDGDGRNSPFTKALLTNLERPGVEISTMMTDVRIQVNHETREKQVPWMRSSLLGHFYFNPTKAKPQQVASLDNNQAVRADPVEQPLTQTKQASRTADQFNNLTIQKELWNTVKDSGDPDMLRVFIGKYGDGFFGDLAKMKLSKLEKSQKTQQVASIDSGQNQTQQVRPNTQTSSFDTNTGSQQNPGIPSLSTYEITYQIQGLLNGFGCNVGRADGQWGGKSRRGLTNFGKYSGIQPVSYQPSWELLKQLRAYNGNGRVCPKVQHRVVNNGIVRRKSRRRPSSNNKEIGNVLGGIVTGIAICKLSRKC